MSDNFGPYDVEEHVRDILDRIYGRVDEVALEALCQVAYEYGSATAATEAETIGMGR